MSQNSIALLVKTNYISIAYFLIIANVLVVVIVSVSYLLINQNIESEKLSSYECGFNPYEDARHILNIKFYVISMLFILFDVEIIYLFPWVISICKLDFLGFWCMIEFVLELFIGFIFVWYTKTFNWK